MHYQLNPLQITQLPLRNRKGMILVTKLALLTLLPILSVGFESNLGQTAFTATLFGKWFIFWSVGSRLLITGSLQIVKGPTASADLRSSRDDNDGFGKATAIANLVLSLLAFLCVANDGWSLLAAITVGIYVGLAGMQLDFKMPSNMNGWVSMGYDFVVFSVVAVCLVF